MGGSCALQRLDTTNLHKPMLPKQATVNAQEKPFSMNEPVQDEFTVRVLSQTKSLQLDKFAHSSEYCDFLKKRSAVFQTLQFC
jgi:hypothetical protein